MSAETSRILPPDLRPIGTPVEEEWKKKYKDELLYFVLPAFCFLLPPCFRLFRAKRIRIGGGIDAWGEHQLEKY
jgi:hypothetical protein